MASNNLVKLLNKTINFDDINIIEIDEMIELLNSQKELLEQIKKFKESNFEINLCISCGANLGESNPRQYCCKTYCPFEE
jgi:hypothetical protein